MLLNTLIKTTQLTSWLSWDSTQVCAAVATLNISQEADPSSAEGVQGRGLSLILPTHLPAENFCQRTPPPPSSEAWPEDRALQVPDEIKPEGTHSAAQANMAHDVNKGGQFEESIRDKTQDRVTLPL